MHKTKVISTSENSVIHSTLYIYYDRPFPCGFGHYKARDPAMYNDQGSFSFLSEHRSSSVRRSSGRHTQHHSSSETTMATTRPACVPSVYVYLFRCVAHGHYSYSKAFLTASHKSRIRLHYSIEQEGNHHQSCKKVLV